MKGSQMSSDSRTTSAAPRIGVVGAGAAGIMASLKAASLGATVHLYDTNHMVGRKLTVAGNGRCNLSNANLDSAVYATDAPSVLAEVLDRYGYPKLVADLDALGIPTYATWDGWTYPVSNSGASVAEILAYALELAGVHVHLLTKVTALSKAAAIERRNDGSAGDMLSLELGNSPQQDVHDRLIVAAGGGAYGALGSRGECFPMLEALGHTVLPVRPALVPLTTDLRPPRDVLQKLHGVRIDVGLTLYAVKRLLGQTLGNLMFTRDGLSGPAPMDLAYLVNGHSDEPLEARIDLVPSHGAVFEEMLARGRERDAPASTVLEAFMPPKVPPVLLTLAGMSPEQRLGAMTDAQVARVRQQVRDLRVPVTGTRPLSQSQLSTGGVPLAEVDGRTMASQLVPGLHLAGEVLNVMGPCGGYNLHWAMASGAVAGSAAATVR